MNVPFLISSIPMIAALLALTRTVPARRRETSKWEELGWMVFCAVLLVGFGGVWLATFPLTDSVAITTPDYQEYCSSVAAALLNRTGDWSQNRSVLSAVPAILAGQRLGVPDGLLVGAWVGQGLLGAGLYLWGRSLHSPLAGVAATVAACAFFPLTALGRTLTFYPMIIGSLTFATGLMTLCWRRPSPLTALAAGSAVALALLIDLRGLAWALPLGGLAALRMVFSPSIRRIALLLGCLCVPIVASWYLAAYAYPPHSVTLEVLSDLTKGWKGIVDVKVNFVPGNASEGYIYGRSAPSRIPHTLQWLAEHSQIIPPELRSHQKTMRHLGQFVGPLAPALKLGAGLAVLALIRTPSRLVLLLGTALPFAVALEGAVAARFAGLRFLANGAPLLALLYGLIIAVLVDGTTHPRRPAARLRLRGSVALGILLLFISGTVSSPLSPMATWRGNYRFADQGLENQCPSPQGLPQQPTLVYSLP